jgi:anthranilate synthase component 1
MGNKINLQWELHNNQVWLRELDWIPDLLDLHEYSQSQFPFLLESVTGFHQTVEAISRYSILFAFPQGSIVKDHKGKLCSNEYSISQQNFLTGLDRAWHETRLECSATDLPFEGGWFVFLGYELVSEIEPTVPVAKQALESPMAVAVRCPAAIVHDHLKGICYAVVEHDYLNLRETMDALLASYPHEQPARETDTVVINNIHEEDPQTYLNSVNKTLRYIYDGDVFQVNLSRRWLAKLESKAHYLAIYRKLRETNPAPFAGLFCWDNFCVSSSSPERLVQCVDKKVQTRPIAGTRPRGDTPEEDEQLIKELLAHPKERAEHIMLIDLERNDLGRVCVPGSVKVSELMVLESYAHVHHIVSNVLGRVAEDVSPVDIIKAVFPGGTITGCPKVRCMQIIAELENRKRGAYTGSMGYINRSGDMDLNILIRTLFNIDENLYLDAGAGIVADSLPDKELAETRAKAKGMLKAIQSS